MFALAGLRILPSAAIISNGILLIGYCNEGLNIIYDDIKKYKRKTNDNFFKEEFTENKIDLKIALNLKKFHFLTIIQRIKFLIKSISN